MFLSFFFMENEALNLTIVLYLYVLLLLLKILIKLLTKDSSVSCEALLNECKVVFLQSLVLRE